jgi:FHS family L-fucose permease-like MFS transporter
VGGAIASKVSSKAMMVCVTIVGMVLILCAMFIDKSTTTSMPVFTGSGFAMETVPLSALLLVLCGLCTSVMWSCVFNLATEGLGKYTAIASGAFMTMVCGFAIMVGIQGLVADWTGSYLTSYWVPLLCAAYILYYALWGSKNVNTDIPVE